MSAGSARRASNALSERLTPDGAVEIEKWRRLTRPVALSCDSSTTRWHALSLTLATLIAGNIACTRLAASCRCWPPPWKPLSTTSGAALNALGGTRGRACDAATSRASEYARMRAVKVGPRGALAMRRYELFSVAVRMRKCVTPKGPATDTKSLSWLRRDSRRLSAVCGSIMRRRSASRLESTAPCLPRRNTNVRGSGFLAVSAPSATCVRFFFWAHSLVDFGGMGLRCVRWGSALGGGGGRSGGGGGQRRRQRRRARAAHRAETAAASCKVLSERLFRASQSNLFAMNSLCAS